MTPFSNIPLAPISFKIWKSPSPMNSGESSTAEAAIATTVAGKSTAAEVMATSSSSSSSSNSTLPYFPAMMNPSPLSGKNSIPGHDNPGKTEAEINAKLRKRNRVLASKLSTQKSRMKKLQNLNNLEMMQKNLEAYVASLQPQVSLFRDQHQSALMENKKLHQFENECRDRIAINNVELEENEEELKKWQQVLMSQHQENIRRPVSETEVEETILNPSSNQPAASAAMGNIHNGVVIEAANDDEMLIDNQPGQLLVMLPDSDHPPVMMDAHEMRNPIWDMINNPNQMYDALERFLNEEENQPNLV